MDRAAFLQALDAVVSRYGLGCLAYCLLDNHFHLVVETPRANLAAAMQRLCSGFAQAFNRRHRRVGHVFQGRYKAVVVEREPHLLEVVRYVALNPVRARACADPEQWMWSSYRATVGLDPPPPFLLVGDVLALFSKNSRTAQENYRGFVADGIDANPFVGLQGRLFLGSNEFAQEHSPGKRMRGVPRSHWQPVRPSLEELEREYGDSSIALAHRKYGYTLEAIADHLGIHATTVGRRLRRQEQTDRVERWV